MEELTTFRTRYNQILYKFDKIPDKNSHSTLEGKVNGFSLTMKASNKNNQTPRKISNPTHGRDKLNICVIEYIIRCERAKFLQAEEYMSAQIVEFITSALWSIDGQ